MLRAVLKDFRVSASEGDMAYWIMKMTMGSGGKDYAKELWSQNLIGLLFGTWPISHVLDDMGIPDSSKLTASAIEEQYPQPAELGFDDKFLRGPRRFLLQVAVDERVVVIFDDAIHIGTVGEGFLEDPEGPRGQYGEVFKCRPVYDKKCFPLADLPSSYRLLSSAARSTIQRIASYRDLVKLLDISRDAEEVRNALVGMSTKDFLDTLSDKQWEVLSEQYLRDVIGLRSLLLGVGGTLKSIDIYGVDNRGNRVLAQCKNDSKAWSVSDLEKLMNTIPSKPEDHLYFFCRGGVEDKDTVVGCTVISSQEVAGWLESNDTYAKQLKTL